jgi:serine/threonine-protein kinase
VLHQIGIGTLGPVFRTYEPTRDRLVAVKVFRLDIVPEQAQALAAALGRAAGSSLLHPSVVEPIAAGVEGTLAYRAEEYVAAESLDVAMRHYAPASIDKVLPFITQLAGAIDFARAAGVGHGGLHPRDIFVTPDEARATGFGVIEALEEVGIRAPVRRPYTAPERIDGNAWTTPADIFSLAAITFEMLTGRRPAGTGTLIGALPDGKHTAALHAVLARAMHDDPAERYGSALGFAAALESAGHGQVEAPAPAPTPTAAPATPPPPRVPVDVEEEPEPVHEPEPTLFDAEEPLAPLPLERFSDDFSGDADLRFASEPEPIRRVEPIRRFEPFERPQADERFAAEPEPEPEPVEAVEPAAEPIMYDAVETSRPAVLPTAIGVVLGLLAGFAGGYFVGSRDRVPSETVTTTAAQSTAAPAGAATHDQAGQFSEQKVTPAPASPAAGVPTASKPTEPKTTEAPPVVQEGEPSRGAARAAPPLSTRERAQSNGTIVVKSTPAHAGVTVNGKWRGRTPLTLEHLALGRYVVRIVQPGYHVAQEEFALGAHDADRTFSAKLEPNVSASKRETAAPKSSVPAAPAGGFFGALYVDSRPRGATVLLDGKNIGVTPMSLAEVPIGSHVVRVELAGKRPWMSTTTVTAGQTARVTMSLEDKQ